MLRAWQPTHKPIRGGGEKLEAHESMPLQNRAAPVAVLKYRQIHENIALLLQPRQNFLHQGRA